MGDYIPQYDLAKKITEAVREVGYAKIITHIIDIGPTIKPSAIRLEVFHQDNNMCVQVAKKILSEYYDRFFTLNEPTPQELECILNQVDECARFAGLQPLHYKYHEGTHQFAVYRPWDVLYPKEKKATIVFYEVPKEWDGSSVAVITGTGAMLKKVGLIK